MYSYFKEILYSLTPCMIQQDNIRDNNSSGELSSYLSQTAKMHS